ncbi:MAG TPA: hypothetical protein VHW00_24190 [Thermoanaerobaculia bacterium]|nr:hypothetical protein [Thermoanaerobaculia bacterium]
MPDHIQYEDDDLFNPETHHESSDVPVKGLLWFIILFIVFGVITHIIILFLHRGFANQERRRMDPPQTAIVRPKSADVPQDQPLLQPFPHTDNKGSYTKQPQADTPVADLIQLRASEEKILKHYGWVDRQKGIVHIPIEEAIGRYAAQAAVQAQTGTSGATDTAAPATVPPGSVTAPGGQPVPADTGVAPSATTTTHTTTGAHQ